MSKEAQQEKPPEAPRPQRNEPIAVKSLRFRMGENVDIPGKLGATSVSTTLDHKPGQAHWLCEYLPWQRHHRVTYTPAGGGAVEARYLHETWCAWDPA